jgi:hypothetical protein
MSICELSCSTVLIISSRNELFPFRGLQHYKDCPYVYSPIYEVC